MGSRQCLLSPKHSLTSRTNAERCATRSNPEVAPKGRERGPIVPQNVWCGYVYITSSSVHRWSLQDCPVAAFCQRAIECSFQQLSKSDVLERHSQNRHIKIVVLNRVQIFCEPIIIQMLMLIFTALNSLVPMRTVVRRSNFVVIM